MFFRWRKAKLVKALVDLRDKYIQLHSKVKHLEQENARLSEQIEHEKIKDTNRKANKPSSKEAEWEKGTSENNDKGKKKRKRGKRKGRKGSGNRPKDLKPSQKSTATVDKCDLCGKDLSDQAPLESTNERIIEDIPDLPEEPIITLVTQQKKYCNECQEVITAKSDLALPKADIGINATVLVCYLWVALCLPYTKIKQYLWTYFQLT